MQRQAFVKTEIVVVLLILAVICGFVGWLTLRPPLPTEESYIRPELRTIQERPTPPNEPVQQKPVEQGEDIPKEQQKEVVKESGLKYLDTRQGKGVKAKVGSTVYVYYKGTLKSGEVFDSNQGRQPFSFVVGAGDVIRGWEEGILGMQIGGKRKLTVPPHLGYGAGGRPPKIPGNAELIFEIEVTNIMNR